MPYCTSCGQPIPEGQGKSCSMCYGDPYHGTDGYYMDYLNGLEQRAMQEKQEKEQQQEEEEERQRNGE